MTQIIATFRLKDEFNPDDNDNITNEEVDDSLREIAEKEDLELISWGTI